MPNPLPTKESKAFGDRLVALLAHAKIARHGAGAYLAGKYKVSGVTANAWLDGLHKCSSARARAIATDHGCTFESLYVGPKIVYLDGTRDDGPQHAEPSPLFTREQYAEGDVAALQLALRSLLTTMLNRIPGTAGAFRQYLTQAAKERHFSMNAGLLASLAGIADEALDAEVAIAQALQRERAADRTKPKK